MVAIDGSEWGLESSDAIIEAREEFGENGQRMEEGQIKSSVAWT